MILTAVDCALIDALARYRLLTIPQAMRLGIGGRDHVGERLRTLERHGLVGILDQARKFGPRLHWLKERGAAEAVALAEERGEELKITAPKRGFVAGPHVWQRIAIVDCHIALRQWLEASGGSVERFHVEFEANPMGQLSKALKFDWERQDGTTAEYPPDGAGIIKLADGSRWLFGLEVETGGEGLRLDNFARQLPDRLAAFADAALERGWHWPKEHKRARLLFVFPDATMAMAARRQLAKYDSPTLPRTFIKSLPEVLTGFADGWVKASGETGSPFRSQ
jgi:hypothetical protein